MNRHRLGKSDLTISRIVFGSMGRRPLSPAEHDRLLGTTLDLGISSIDTAPLYDFGEVERELGRALRGRRQQVELLGKVGLRWEEAEGEVLFEFNDARGNRRAVRKDSRPVSIRRDVEDSLTRLETDTLDLCQIHHPDPRVPFAESLGELERLKEEGKIRHIGVSNFSPAQITEALGKDVGGAQADPSARTLVSNQVHLSLLTQAPWITASRAACVTEDLDAPSLLAFSCLEFGALSGRMLGAQGFDAIARARGPHFHPANAARIADALRDTALPIADEHGASLSQLALAWLLHEPRIAGVIVGASRPEQMRENAQSVEIELSANEWTALHDRFASIRLDPFAGKGFKDRGRDLARRTLRRIRRELSRRLGHE